MPHVLRYLFEHFEEVSQGRAYGDFGPQVLSWTELHSWSQLTLTELTPTEIRIIRLLDLVWMQARRKPHG